MKKFLLFLGLPLLGQTILPTVTPNAIPVNKTVTITLTYNPGPSQAAAIQWASVLPAGSTIIWSLSSGPTSENKTLSCNSSGLICIIYGLNTTTIAGGILATGILSVGATGHGPQTFTVSSAFGADATGLAISMSGGAVGYSIVSIFDLNADGLVNAADLSLAIQQVIGNTACVTADFNNDGKCDSVDILLLVLDSMSPNP
jgi:hypothetical protein